MPKMHILLRQTQPLRLFVGSSELRHRRRLDCLVKRVFPLLHVNPMVSVVPKETACLSLLRFLCGSTLTLSSLLLFCTFLVMMVVLEDVSYGSKIWVMEILVGVMFFCSCTGLYWLIFEFSPANLVMVLDHVWVVMVALASPYPLLLINLLMWMKLVDAMMFWVYVSDSISWLLSRKFPKVEWLKLINMPVILGATALMPPAKPIHYLMWFAVGIFFNVYVYRQHRAWWGRHNYILSAALDAGVAFMAVLVYFTLQSKGISSPEWWGQDSTDHCPLAKCPTAPGVKVPGCPIFCRTSELLDS